MQPAVSVPRLDPLGQRQSGLLPLGETRRGAEPALLFTRGALASRTHRLLGLGAVGSARLGQSQPALSAAFGGDVASWGRAGTPWLAARSLARPVETLPGHSAVGWLLGNRGG